MRTHPLLLGALEDDSLEARNPAVDLARPVVQSRFRDDDQMRTVNAADKFEVAEEGNRLQRLAETLSSSGSGLAPGVGERKLGRGGTHHLVCENTVDAVVVQSAHPVETLNLVLAHLSSFDDCVGPVSQPLRTFLSTCERSGAELTCGRLGKHERTVAFCEAVRLLLCLEQLGVFVLLRLAATRLRRLTSTADASKALPSDSV